MNIEGKVSKRCSYSVYIAIGTFLHTQESVCTKPSVNILFRFVGYQYVLLLLLFYLLEPCEFATVVNFRHRFIVKFDLQSSNITTTYNYTRDSSALSYSELLTALS